MPTNLKKNQNKKTSKKNNEHQPTFMEIYFRSILNVSLLVLFFRVATAIVAGFVFRGYWRVILYLDTIPVIAFTEKIEEFKLINSFSIFFMNIVIFLIFIKTFLDNREQKTARVSAWFFGVVMAVLTHVLNIYFSTLDSRFSINDTLDQPLIIYLILTTILYISYLTFGRQKKDKKDAAK